MQGRESCRVGGGRLGFAGAGAREAVGSRAGAWTPGRGGRGVDVGAGGPKRRRTLGPRWLALAVMAQMVMGARHNVLGFRREIVNGSALGEECVQRIELRSSFHKDARKVAAVFHATEASLGIFDAVVLTDVRASTGRAEPAPGPILAPRP